MESRRRVLPYIETERGATIVCSWKHRKGHSVLVRPRSSFTPNVALLVCPSGTVHPTVDHYGFTRSQR